MKSRKFEVDLKYECSPLHINPKASTFRMTSMVNIEVITMSIDWRII